MTSGKRSWERVWQDLFPLVIGAQEAFDAAPVDIAPGASAFADEPVSDAPLRGSIYKLRLHYIYTSQDDIYMYS